MTLKVMPKNRTKNSHTNSIMIPDPRYKVTMLERDGGHWYQVDFQNGSMPEIYPGVTTIKGILEKPGLMIWGKNTALLSVEQALKKRLNGRSNKQVRITNAWIKEIIDAGRKKPEEERDEAADIGHQAHEIWDAIIHGHPYTVPKELEQTISRMTDWWSKFGMEIVLGDTAVASIIHGFGGRFDALGFRDGKFILLDWKTGNYSKYQKTGIYEDFAFQLAAYAQAIRETYNIIVSKAYCVRSSKKLAEHEAGVGFEVKKVKDLQLSLKGFLGCKEAYDTLLCEQYDEQSALH